MEIQVSRQLVPCKDGHAPDRSQLRQVFPSVQANDLWIADRNFCSTDSLLGIAARKAKSVIRQHGQTSRLELPGTRRNIGRCLTGTIYEQEVRLRDAEDNWKDVRRITSNLRN